MESEKGDKVSIPRFRGSRFNKVKKLDIFPKLEEPYKETSPVGGTFSLISFAIIIWLLYSEVNYYLNSTVKFKFNPDIELEEKLKINIDLTVAMPCQHPMLSLHLGTIDPYVVAVHGDPIGPATTFEYIQIRIHHYSCSEANNKNVYIDVGADILDSTNQNANKFGQLEEEDTWFELAPNQQAHFDNQKHFNSYLREEYHNIRDLLWRTSFLTNFGDLPPRSQVPDKPHDACRIYGSFILNKVAGNFHITAGKSITLPRGHIHISAFMSESDYNFTHRINKFSFGDPSPGIVHPLEGDEVIITHGSTVISYFIEVVPTTVKTFLKSISTYQYSVKELRRPLNHATGSHGMPGIFFKYDMSALRVNIIQERDHLGMFLARLCSIIGGVYVCSGIVNSVVQLIVNFVMCNWLKSSQISDKERLMSNVIEYDQPVTSVPS